MYSFSFFDFIRVSLKADLIKILNFDNFRKTCNLNYLKIHLFPSNIMT